jgi:hypothetical protein
MERRAKPGVGRREKGGGRSRERREEAGVGTGDDDILAWCAKFFFYPNNWIILSKET